MQPCSRSNPCNALVIFSLIAFAICSPSVRAQTGEGQSLLKVLGTTAFETVEAPVMKVYAVEQDGARFRAYAVEWRGKEVVVLDLSGRSERSVGDTVRFMVQRTAGGDGGAASQLRFILLDSPAAAR